MTKKTLTPDATCDDLHARIEQRNEILSQIQTARTELEVLSDQESSIRNQLNEVHAEVRGIESDIEFKQSGHKDANLGALPGRLERFQAQRDELQHRHQEVLQRKEQAMVKIQHLEYVALPACMQATSVAEVLAHQDAIAASGDEERRLMAVIDTQRRIIDETRASLIEPPSRDGERAELLAEIALGHKRQDDLEALETQVIERRQDFENACAEASPIIQRAQQTIDGLQHKVAGVKEHLAQLRAKTPEVLRQYMVGEAERVAAEYAEHAKAVKNGFLAMYGIEQLLYVITGKSPNILRDRDLVIPAANLDACREFIHPATPRQLFGDYAGLLKNASDFERNRLHALGITLL